MCDGTGGAREPGERDSIERIRRAGELHPRGFAQAARWHAQLHLFHIPFYYVEYGIAQLGALQLWQNYRQDPTQALARYQAALSLGNTRPLPELVTLTRLVLVRSSRMFIFFRINLK